MHEETLKAVKAREERVARAKSAKRTGGNWLPVAAAAHEALQDCRDLYKIVLRMRHLTYELVDKGEAVTPAAAEWDLLLDHVQNIAERLRKGLKGR